MIKLKDILLEAQRNRYKNLGVSKQRIMKIRAECKAAIKLYDEKRIVFYRGAHQGNPLSTINPTITFRNASDGGNFLNLLMRQFANY